MSRILEQTTRWFYGLKANQKSLDQYGEVCASTQFNYFLDISQRFRQ